MSVQHNTWYMFVTSIPQAKLKQVTHYCNFLDSWIIVRGGPKELGNTFQSIEKESWKDFGACDAARLLAK